MILGDQRLHPYGMFAPFRYSRDYQLVGYIMHLCARVQHAALGEIIIDCTALVAEDGRWEVLKPVGTGKRRTRI